MIVLPNTPLTPKLPKPPNPILAKGLKAETLSTRASISSVAPANHAELTQFMLRLELYLESIFEDIVPHSESKDLADIVKVASDVTVSTLVPWTNVVYRHAIKSALRLLKPAVSWSLTTEIVATTVALAEAYICLAADIIQELTETTFETNPDIPATDLDEKWRLVAEHYKSALLLISFASKLQTAAGLNGTPLLFFNQSIFALLDKICNIGIQMSMVCKSSWQNRASYTSRESFVSSNNGVLCRVAIWVFNEVLACQNILQELSEGGSQQGLLELNYEKWPEYLSIFFKYVTAYSGLFLAIENYQKDKLGQAIGLLNFSLLTLQSKNLGEVKRKGLDRFKRKISGRKNDNFIANLESMSSLNIDKSVFLELSGAMLSDLSLLFDQLVLLHLKFSKENDNLRFDTVTDWKDTRADLKWPLGARIPVSSPKEYLPKAMCSSTSEESVTHERGSYF